MKLKKPNTKRSLYKDIENQWANELKENPCMQIPEKLMKNNNQCHNNSFINDSMPSNKNSVKTPKKRLSRSPTKRKSTKTTALLEIQNSPRKDPVLNSPRKDEQRERLMGALALVQLAHSDKF